MMSNYRVFSLSPFCIILTLGGIAYILIYCSTSLRKLNEGNIETNYVLKKILLHAYKYKTM